MRTYEQLTDEMVKYFAQKATVQRLMVAKMNIERDLERVNVSLEITRSDKKMYRHTEFYERTEKIHLKLITRKMRIYACLQIVRHEMEARTSSWKD